MICQLEEYVTERNLFTASVSQSNIPTGLIPTALSFLAEILLELHLCILTTP